LGGKALFLSEPALAGEVGAGKLGDPVHAGIQPIQLDNSPPPIMAFQIPAYPQHRLAHVSNIKGRRS